MLQKTQERNGQMLWSSRSLHRKTIEKQISGMQKNVLCNFKISGTHLSCLGRCFNKRDPVTSGEFLGLTCLYSTRGQVTFVPHQHHRDIVAVFDTVYLLPAQKQSTTRLIFSHRVICEILLGLSLVPQWFPYSSALNHIKKQVGILMQFREVMLLNWHFICLAWNQSSKTFDHILSFQKGKEICS